MVAEGAPPAPTRRATRGPAARHAGQRKQRAVRRPPPPTPSSARDAVQAHPGASERARPPGPSDLRPRPPQAARRPTARPAAGPAAGPNEHRRGCTRRAGRRPAPNRLRPGRREECDTGRAHENTATEAARPSSRRRRRGASTRPSPDPRCRAQRPAGGSERVARRPDPRGMSRRYPTPSSRFANTKVSTSVSSAGAHSSRRTGREPPRRRDTSRPHDNGTDRSARTRHERPGGSHSAPIGRPPRR